MKKAIVGILLLALVVALAGCAQQEKTEGTYLGEKGKEGTQSQAKGETNLDAPNQSKVETKLFNVVAKQSFFEPATITVNKGDTVELHITTGDVKHGFMLTAYNINETIEPGKLTDIEFVADKAGEFPFYCSVPCGPGHPEMEGLLIVKE